MLWCDPEEKGCPFNPAHDDHELYCGPSNKDYVDFLKILRSRVESWSRNTEKENEAMRVLQQQNKIKSETFKMLQKAFAHFQHATALIHGGRQAGCKENSDSAPDLAKKNCAACQVTNDACVGNPVGVATADKLDTTNWCGDNCAIAAPKKLPNKAAEANIMSKVKAMLSKLTLEVMEGNAQEVCSSPTACCPHRQPSNLTPSTLDPHTAPRRLRITVSWHIRKPRLLTTRPV